MLRADTSEQSARYGWYTAGVLMVAYSFSFLDRQILNLMVGPIKHDFHISDVQFALLSGGAFGIFYTVMGLPIGWLADRYPRKWIITTGISLWSLMTAACAIAGSFPAFLLTRVGVGIGEATLSPSTYSMLTDLFDRARLPRAMSLYSVGIYVGAGTSMILGGTTVAALTGAQPVTLPVLGTIASWQLVFVVVGLPGLLVALWVTTLPEPARRSTAGGPTVARRAFSLQPIWSFLCAHPRMSIALFLGSAVLGILSYMDAWYPELFIRRWGWDARLTGTVNGAASLTAGPLGMIAAGVWSGRLLRAGQSDACLRLTAYAAAGMGLAAGLMPLMPSPTLMASCLWPIKFLGGFTPVLIPSAIQLVCPPQLRAQMGAIFMLTVGIVGVSFGPILPALLTDYLFRDEHSLGYSLSVSAALVGPLASVLLSRGLPQYRRRSSEMTVEEHPA
jgi:MFS family permease